MSMNPSSGHRPKRRPPDDNKSSTHNLNGSEAGPPKIKDPVKLFEKHPEFNRIIKDLKNYDRSLDSAYNHGETGLKAHQNEIQKAIKTLEETPKTIVDKVKIILQVTEQKKDRIRDLESAKDDCESQMERDSNPK
ncbi:uncharacterized protein Bfra_007612 [Botrytis fragariae]|uniref:Uncharacterized protein n=1 Tax=Botrytis fragariae TaxID=1964551 RepID=A0A8H6API1_9HELO|nr:uncharacterized protein Bfra_007612 [Botrytis fragariae]KAF5871099.1 hypothetical protein Bfra_007612 [Botrytis fragariae]